MRNMLSAVGIVALIALAPATPAAQDANVPTFEQVIDLKRPGGTAISPDGRMVAFTLNETNWDDNAYETEIFLVRALGQEPIQLTRAKKSSTAPAW